MQPQSDLAWVETLPLENISALLRKLATRLEPAGAPPAEPDQRLVDAVAMAAHLRVPESWVRGEQRANRIPYLKLGRYIRFRVADVEAALAARPK